MLAPPDDLDDGVLARFVAEQWALSVPVLAYRPVGFGSHHWAAGPWFVTVDDLRTRRARTAESLDAVADRLTVAFAVPARLRAAGVAALAARPTAAGALAARLGDEFLVRVDPFVGADAAGPGATYADDSVRLQVIDLVADAHRATPAVVDVAPPADETIPMVDAVRGALDDLERPWDSGPFAEPLRALLTQHADALDHALGAHAAMVTALVDPARLVITHGETHPRNVLVTPDGPLLIDWDTCRLGLPERDLRDLRAPGDPATRRYEQRTGTTVDPRAMAMYDLAWDLTDIALYVGLLRAEHHDDPNSAASWRNLAKTFPLRATY